jgi:hypothetical protein
MTILLIPRIFIYGAIRRWENQIIFTIPKKEPCFPPISFRLSPLRRFKQFPLPRSITITDRSLHKKGRVALTLPFLFPQVRLRPYLSGNDYFLANSSMAPRMTGYTWSWASQVMIQSLLSGTPFLEHPSIFLRIPPNKLWA